jgi:rhamnosyltransferase
MLKKFGSANGEGKRFVLSELHYLWEQDSLQIPSALIRTIMKLLGYRLGQLEELIPPGIKCKLSMHPSFWE